MASIAYRLTYPVIAVIQEESSYLQELPAGSMFYRASQKPDAQGLVKGTWSGQIVLLFECDLEERAEPLAQVSEPERVRFRMEASE